MRIEHKKSNTVLSHLTHYTNSEAVPIKKVQRPPIQTPSIKFWEKLPKNVFLFPLYLFAIGKAIMNRTMWLFSTSNPGMTFGSFFGMTKSEVYDLLPEGTYPDTLLIRPSQSFEEITAQINTAKIQFPFIVKPDVGMVGLLVRVIQDEEQLKNYYDLVKVDWLIQAFVPYDVEVGLFYVRHPDQKKGRIVGLSEKRPLSVIGNGKSTIEDLVKLDKRASEFEEDIRRKQGNNWKRIPRNGEFVQLVMTGNRKNGAQLIELVNEVDDNLLSLFDKISHHKNRIYYGRYDIKCSSLADLKQGKNFAILEFNGVHSGYGHLYHCGKSGWEAYTTIFKLWVDLYHICMANYKKGVKFVPFAKGWKLLYKTIMHFIKISKWEKRLP